MPNVTKFRDKKTGIIYIIKDQIARENILQLNTSKYTKPSSGIPMEDLSSDVQTAINNGGGSSVLADWNETSATNAAYIKNKPTIPSDLSDLTNNAGYTKNIGTVTGIKMNGGNPVSPTNGVVDLGTVITQHQDITGKVDKETGKSLMSEDEHSKLDALPSASELEEQLSNAGSVQSVTINGTNHTPTNGIVNLGTIQGEQGPQGPLGNSGYTGAANELEVVNNLTDGGATKALSAEMGKELGMYSVIESGTFAKAYMKAIYNDSPFPWVLEDTDDNNNPVTKMIWHIGNHKFIDATGADVNWYKNGITVVTSGPCALRVLHGNTVSQVKDIIIPRSGITNIPFSDLLINSNNALGVIYKGTFLLVTSEIINGEEVFSQTLVTGVSTGDSSTRANNVVYVDFGGLAVTSSFSFYGQYGDSLLGIDNLVMQGGDTLSWNGWLNRQRNLRHIGNISGNITFNKTEQQIFLASYGPIPNVTKLDIKNLVCPFIKIGFANLKYLDIRGMNPKLSKDYVDGAYIDTYTLASDFLTGTGNLRTLVIGDFDTSNITGVNSGKKFIGSLTNCTLVCTKQTPPATNQQGFVIDDLLNKVTTILVPPGSLAAYQAADWWGDYASKMSEYNEGDY